MEKRILRTDSLSVNYQSYEEIFKEPDLPIWDIMRGMSVLGGGKSDWIIESNTNTITTLLSTGDIKLIPPILRNKILDLKHKQLGFKGYIKTHIEALINSSISTATLYGGTSLGKRAGNQPKLIKYYNDEIIQVQSLMGLEAVLDDTLRHNLNVKKRYTELILDIEEITKLINEEMKK